MTSKNLRSHRASVVAIALASTMPVLTIPMYAHAETRTASATGTTLEAAWTTCPAYPSKTTDCNYTGVYAGKYGSTKPAIIIHLSSLRVFPDGSVQVLASAVGIDQPANVYKVPKATLASGSASGNVYLYGDCGDPTNIATCYYYGTAALSTSFKQNGGAWSWGQTNSVTSPSSIKYSVNNSGASRPANPIGSAAYNGYNWALGTYISGRIARFTNKQTLTCPGACPSNAEAAAPEQQTLANVPSLDSPTLKVPAPQVPAAIGNVGVDESEAAHIAAGTANLLDPSARTSNSGR